MIILISLTTYAYPLVPDSGMTSGELCDTDNPDFSEFRYQEHIPYCTRNVSGSTKSAIYQAYGIPKGCRNRYTIDHFFPLSLGGDNSTVNLWPEHKLVKATRPNLEEDLYHQIANGEITQRKALNIIIEAKTTAALKNAEMIRADIASGCDTPDSFSAAN